MGRGGFIVLILLATSGCGGGPSGGPPDSAVAPPGAWVEVGTGTTAFEPLASEADLELVAGPQGGHHFIVHARMAGLQPGDPTMPGTSQNPATRFTVWSEDGEQLDIEPPPYRLGYEEAGAGVFALVSGHIIQVREEEVPAMHGARVRVAVEVTDATGATVRDERWVVATEDPDGPDGEADAGPPAAWAEIGTGLDDFEPLAPEGDLALYSGIQGGRHVFLHARMMGLDPGDPETSCDPGNPQTLFTVFDEGGGRFDTSSGPCRLSYLPDGEAFVLRNEVQVTFIELPDLGDRVRVRVVVSDGGGLQASDERWVRLVEP